MKKTIFTLIAIVTFASTTIVNGQSPMDKVYEKYAGQDGITAVSFNKEMFQMFQQMSVAKDTANGDIKNAKKVMEQLTGLKVLMYKFDSTGIPKAVSMYNEFAAPFASKDYKELMTVQEGREYFKFMTKSSTAGKVSEFVMLLKSKDEVGVISLMGDIDLSTISTMSKYMNIKGMENLKKMKDSHGPKH